MRRVFVTSDLHFGHANIMKFCPQTRAFANGDVTEMNEQMIRMWNAEVQDGDLVYILGDVAFLPADKAVKILRRLNGDKILVKGNHDRKLMQDPDFRGQFMSCHDYVDIMHNGVKVVMFHYPIAEWDQMHRGSVHLHGHLHGSPSGLEKYRCRDAGFDASGRIVRFMDEIVKDALTGEIKGHH